MHTQITIKTPSEQLHQFISCFTYNNSLFDKIKLGIRTLEIFTAGVMGTSDERLGSGLLAAPLQISSAVATVLRARKEMATS